MSNQLRLVIHFTDGSKLNCAFQRQTDDPIKQQQNIRRAMEMETLAMEMEGQLFFIPMANVKYIQISPAPQQLPDGVVQGATIVS